MCPDSISSYLESAGVWCILRGNNVSIQIGIRGGKQYGPEDIKISDPSKEEKVPTIGDGATAERTADGKEIMLHFYKGNLLGYVESSNPKQNPVLQDVVNMAKLFERAFPMQPRFLLN